MLQRKPESIIVLNYFDVVYISPQSKTLPQLRSIVNVYTTAIVVGYSKPLFKDIDRCLGKPGEMVKQGLGIETMQEFWEENSILANSVP